MRVRIIREAREELADILRFVARNNRTASDRLHASFQAAFARLRMFPYSGNVRHNLPRSPRALVVNPYIVLYAVASDEVSVVHIYDGRRDVKALLDDE